MATPWPVANLPAARSITVTGSNERTVQVASGLNHGDIVVTAGAQALRPGQKVRPLETPPDGPPHR